MSLSLSLYVCVYVCACVCVSGQWRNLNERIRFRLGFGAARMSVLGRPAHLYPPRYR